MKKLSEPYRTLKIKYAPHQMYHDPVNCAKQGCNEVIFHDEPKMYFTPDTYYHLYCWETRHDIIEDSRSNPARNYKYLITFTRNPNARYSLHAWFARIRFECQKAFVVECQCAVEHRETNIHVHSLIISNKKITKREYKVFIRDFGFVDVRILKTDNGVKAYIEKEYGEAVQPSELC